MKNKALIIVVLIVFAILNLTSCQRYYSGEYTDLYTVAVNSLLWCKGMSSKADFVCNPNIEIIEEDNFGRVLFEYSESSFNHDVAFSALLVLQFTENNYAYYYEDFNFICKEKYSRGEDPCFTLEEMAKLKELNDWNKEINVNKCVKKAISNKKEEISVNRDLLKNILSSYNGYTGDTSFSLTKDDYGRFLVYSCVVIQENEAYLDKYIVLLLNPDNSYSILEISSLYNYQKELYHFKHENHWNQSLN